MRTFYVPSGGWPTGETKDDFEWNNNYYLKLLDRVKYWLCERCTWVSCSVECLGECKQGFYEEHVSLPLCSFTLCVIKLSHFLPVFAAGFCIHWCCDIAVCCSVLGIWADESNTTGLSSATNCCKDLVSKHGHQDSWEWTALPTSFVGIQTRWGKWHP